MRTLQDIAALIRQFDAIHGPGAFAREAIVTVAVLPVLWGAACAFLLIVGGSHA